VATLEALRWTALLEPVRRATKDCTRFRDDSQRESCGVTIDIRNELARAREYERLTHEAGVLRDRRAALDIDAAQDPMQHAFEVSFGKVIKINGKDGIALLGALLLNLVSALGPFGLDILSGDYRADDRAAHKGGPCEPARDTAQIYPREVAQRPEACPPAGSGDTSKPAQTAVAMGLGQTHRSAHAPARGGIDHTAAANAVREFVAMLQIDEFARPTGSELARAYDLGRDRRGWPELPKNVFGFLLKIAVEARGGRKIKSCNQFYAGVRIPASWPPETLG
jgi:hypothetical protein